MPVQSWAHSQYWTFSDTVVAPIVRTEAGYPGWQGGVIAGSGFGAAQRWWERLAWLCGWLLRVWRWSPAQAAWMDAHVEDVLTHKAVLHRVCVTLAHPAYPAAQQAVRQTATTLGFNKREAWAQFSHKLKDRHDWAENSWRHLHAMHLLCEAAGSTMTNPERNLMTELAYAEFAAKGR